MFTLTTDCEQIVCTSVFFLIIHTIEKSKLKKLREKWFADNKSILLAFSTLPTNTGTLVTSSQISKSFVPHEVSYLMLFCCVSSSKHTKNTHKDECQFYTCLHVNPTHVTTRNVFPYLD